MTKRTMLVLSLGALFGVTMYVAGYSHGRRGAEMRLALEKSPDQIGEPAKGSEPSKQDQPAANSTAAKKQLEEQNALVAELIKRHAPGGRPQVPCSEGGEPRPANDPLGIR